MNSAAPAPRIVAGQTRRQRGRLTIFFGMAPGVGKTYAMLLAARESVARGVDLVVGYVLTHGRPETEALLEGLTVLPRRTGSEHTFSDSAFRRDVGSADEFDLDGALARRPALLLVDELAHENRPGSRRKKRWQDVEELLDAGIDVHTTLNVQHLESLASVVEQVTGARVFETVPDRLLAQATEVKLVDLPPDELLGRLANGKVYRPRSGDGGLTRAENAAENFFRKGNLLALRELALRAVADRVDADLAHFRDLHAIERSWPIAEHLLVCVSPSPHAGALVRAGARAAAPLRAKLTCAYVGTGMPLADGAEQRLAKHFERAEQLGAEIVRLDGEDPIATLVQFARKKNITKILVGKPTHSPLRDRFQPPFVEKLIRASGDIAVWVLPPTREDEARNSKTREDESRNAKILEDTPLFARAKPRSPREFQRWAVAVLAPLLSTAIGRFAFGASERADAVMLYLFGVVLIALRFGQMASLVAAALSVLAYDLFFVPPLYTLAVADFRHIVTFFVLFFVAGTIARLVARVRRQKRAAEQREAFTRALYDASRALSEADTEEAIRAVAVTIPTELHAESVCVQTFLDDDRPQDEATGDRRLLAGSGAEVVALTRREGKTTGRFTQTLESADVLAWPLRFGAPENKDGSAPSSEEQVLGVLVVKPRAALRDPSERARIQALARLVGDSLGRLLLRRRLAHAEVAVETEQVKARILSSVSHDLRTPLAVIVGAAETMATEGISTQAPVVRDLARSIGAEAERLARLVTNLLSLTRLASGTLDLKREVVPLDEILAPVLARVEGRESEIPFVVSLDIPIDLPHVLGDPILLEQLFENLLDNARRYAPIDVRLRARVARAPEKILGSDASGRGPLLTIEISDRGPGVPETRRATLFEPLARASAGNGGLGLGLSICRGIARAHGGDLVLDDRASPGSHFVVTLPSAPAMTEDFEE